MPTLADLSNFDAGKYIQFAQAGQQQRTLGQLGQLAAQGNYGGAASAAFAGGQPDIAMRLKSMADEEKAQLVENAASGAYSADTPEKWQQFKTSFEQTHPGFTVPPFQARDVLINQAMSVKDKLAQANSDRAYALDQQRIAQGGVGGADLGVTPIYGQDANGNTVILQTGKTGAGAVAQFPSGVRPLSPSELNQERAYGSGRGKAEAAKPEDAIKQQSLLNALDQQWSTVSQDIGRALDSINSGWVPRAGLGAMAAGVPGTPQYDLSQLLETIKANIGFDKLQEMRNNSPTGGALGQVSDFENKLLAAVRGSLAQGQSSPQLKANLERVKTYLDQLREDRHAAFMRDYGGLLGGDVGGVPAAAPPVAAPSGPVDWQSYFGQQ